MNNNRQLRIRGTDIGYITVDGSGVITSCNSLAAIRLSANPEQLIDRDILDVLANDERFRPLYDRLKLPFKVLKNEQFNLPNFHSSKKDSLTVRLVKLPDARGETAGLYIGLIDRSEAVTTRALALNSIAEGVFTVD